MYVAPTTFLLDTDSLHKELILTKREPNLPAGIFLQVFTGVVSAVGGGVLRDIMAQEMPYIFTKHIYAVACVIGALVCALLWRWNPVFSMTIGFLVVFVIRCLSNRFKWNLPKA